MIACSDCGRHHRDDASACPFCAAPSPLRSQVLRTLGAVVTPLVLAACYGAPPGEIVDEDGDGFSTMEDCDDTNAAVNPDAAEDCANGIDDDCDGLIDDADDDCGGDSGAGS